MDEELRAALFEGVPPSLIPIVEVLFRFTGDGAGQLFAQMLQDGELARWSKEPETTFHQMSKTIGGLLDGRPEPTEPEAASAVLAFLIHLRHYLAEAEKDPTFLGSADGRHLRQFLEGVRNGIGIQRLVLILRAVPGLLSRRFIDGGIALAAATVTSPGHFESRVRGRIDNIFAAAELSWLPILHTYLALTDARDGVARRYGRRMVGAFHHLCEETWGTSELAVALLDQDLVTIRNARAHPRLLHIDVPSEVVAFDGRTSLGPVSDEDLRHKAEHFLPKLHTAVLALMSVVFGEVFRELDGRGWTLNAGQPLLPQVL